MPLLKLNQDDPQRELEFEIFHSLKQSPTERLEQWFDWNLEMLKWMESLHEYQETPSVVKHT